MTHGVRSVALSALVAVSGCATIVNGTRENVSTSSIPSGARVSVNGSPAGITPITVKIGRYTSPVVRLELEGYEPYEVKLAKSMSGGGVLEATLGNWWNGFLPGFIVDAVTGSLYQLSPSQVAATLPRRGADAGLLEKNTIYISVVLSADTSWRKIGELKRR